MPKNVGGRPEGSKGGFGGGDTVKTALTWEFQRSYWYDTHDENGKSTGETPDGWKSRVLSELTLEKLGCDWLVLMFHDLDEKSDSFDFEKVPVNLHLHAVGHVDRKHHNTTQSAMMRRAGVTRAKNCERVKNKKGSLRYLFHVTKRALDAGKYVYDVSDAIVLVADGCPFDLRKSMAGRTIEEQAEDKASKYEELQRDVLCGRLCYDQARAYYKEDPDGLGFTVGDWRKQRTGFKWLEDDFLDDKRRWLSSHRRCLVTGYIEAEGGLAKTELAVYLANRYNEENGCKRGIHQVGTKGKDKTFDLAGNYRGEAVSVLNELDGAAFSPDEFCSLFDPLHAPVANSRHVDKPWFPDLAIMTTSRHFEQFIWDCYNQYAREKIHPQGEAPTDDKGWYELLTSRRDVADKIRQIRRRFVWRVNLRRGDDGHVHAMVYVRDDSINPPLLVQGKKEIDGVFWVGCWRLVGHVVDPDDNMKAVGDLVADATRLYYEINSDYDVTPWNVEKYQ